MKLEGLDAQISSSQYKQFPQSIPFDAMLLSNSSCPRLTELEDSIWESPVELGVLCELPSSCNAEAETLRGGMLSSKFFPDVPSDE